MVSNYVLIAIFVHVMYEGYGFACFNVYDYGRVHVHVYWEEKGRAKTSSNLFECVSHVLTAATKPYNYTP